MSYLLDSNIVISFLNGRADAVALISELADTGLAISIVVWAGAYEGLLAESMGTRARQLDTFTESVDLLMPDLPVARRYANIRSILRSLGQLLADNDLWIAATALTHDLILISRDQHFARVPGLKLYPFPSTAP